MGEPIADDTFLVMLNSFGDSVMYTLPQSPRNRGWKLLMNTHDLEDPFGEKLLDGALAVAGRSVVILRELTEGEAQESRSEQVHLEQSVNQPEPAPEAEEPVLEGA